tara:strand:+ start:399 stop:782 length:384 start_codon:yes stop_codon:yes gene_type:complete
MTDLDKGKTQSLHPSRSKVKTKSFSINGTLFYAGIFDVSLAGDSFCLVSWNMNGDEKWRFVHMLKASPSYVQDVGGYDMFLSRIIRELNEWLLRFLPNTEELSPHLTELQEMINTLKYDEQEKGFSK